MRVTYLGPAVVGVEHPAVAEMDRRKFSPSCFLVEISDEVEVERLLALCEAGRRGKRNRAGEVNRKDSFQQVLSEMGIDRSETTGSRQAS